MAYPCSAKSERFQDFIIFCFIFSIVAKKLEEKKNNQIATKKKIYKQKIVNPFAAKDVWDRDL